MKANELRIGNWIEFNNFISSPNNLQVTPRMFRQLGMDLSENLDLELSGYHKPIPLTEEWLVKFGFEVNTDYASEDNNWYDYLKNYVRISMPYFTYNFENGESEIEIKHVHQLQNLYFALTGEELRITN